jgi:hypothetical protein
MTKSHTDADFDKAMQEQGVPEVGFGNIKQEQGEPVAKIETRTALLRCPRCGNADKLRVDIEYAPQQRTWVGLTDDERNRTMLSYYARTEPLAEAIEAKLKEKNGL